MILHGQTETGKIVPLLVNEQGYLQAIDLTIPPGADVARDVQKVTEEFDVAVLTSSALLRTGPGAVRGFVITAGTAVTVAIYDATSATGTPIYPASALNAGAVVTLPSTRKCLTGIYVAVTGTITVEVYYR